MKKLVGDENSISLEWRHKGSFFPLRQAQETSRRSGPGLMLERTLFSRLFQRSRISLLPAALMLFAPKGVQAFSFSEVTEHSDTTVELHCRIVSSAKDRGYRLWRVEVRKSTGEPLRQVISATGDTAKFKNLRPGMYILCVTGDRGRNRCKSMDLIPPPGKKEHRFVDMFEAPAPMVNQADVHRVSATRLSVPGKAHKEMLRAEEAQLRGDKEQALRHLERAIEIYPDYTDALNNLGTYHHRNGNFSRSVECFSKAAKLEPEFFPAWVNLGGSLLAAGNPDAALAANKRAVELRPNDPLANSQMGINYFYLRNYSDAKIYLQKVLSLDPSSANSPQLFLAHIAFAERQTGEAEHYIRSFLDLHPNSPQAPHLRRTLQNLAVGGFATPQEGPNPRR